MARRRQAPYPSTSTLHFLHLTIHHLPRQAQPLPHLPRRLPQPLRLRGRARQVPLHQHRVQHQPHPHGRAERAIRRRRRHVLPAPQHAPKIRLHHRPPGAIPGGLGPTARMQRPQPLLDTPTRVRARGALRQQPRDLRAGQRHAHGPDQPAAVQQHGRQHGERAHGDDGAEVAPRAQHPRAVHVDPPLARDGPPRAPQRVRARAEQRDPRSADARVAAEGRVEDRQAGRHAGRGEREARVAEGAVDARVAGADGGDELQHREHGGRQHEEEVHGQARGVARVVQVLVAGARRAVRAGWGAEGAVVDEVREFEGGEEEEDAAEGEDCGGARGSAGRRRGWGSEGGERAADARDGAGQGREGRGGGRGDEK